MLITYKNSMGFAARNVENMMDESQLHNSLVHPTQNKDNRCYSKRRRNRLAINRPSGKAPRHKRHHATSQ
jgi:hypothetical protein